MILFLSFSSDIRVHTLLMSQSIYYFVRINFRECNPIIIASDSSNGFEYFLLSSIW